MAEPHALLDADGRPIRCRHDGMLIAGDRPDGAGTRSVVVMVGTDGGGSLLIEADGVAIRLRPDGPAQPVAGLWIDDVDRHMVVLREGRDGPFLQLVDDVVLAIATDGSDAARFRLKALPGRLPTGMMVARLPAMLSFDVSGLQRLFGGGDARLVPLIEALLPTVAIETVREAWAITPRIPERDVFHAALRAQSRLRVRRFDHYTRDLLAPFIERHGWSIGTETYGRPSLMEVGRGHLTIGRYCSMADPHIILGNHDTRSASSYPFVDMWAEWPGATVDMTDHVGRDVVIGNDVWIGINVVILSGAVIGDGAVIGAGCIVRGHVPPYAIWTGNPGGMRGTRFPPAQIERLLRLRWWDWPEARVDRCLPSLLLHDIEAFLDAAEREDEQHTTASLG